MIYVMVDVLKHGRIFRDSIYHLPVTRMEFNNPELDINGMWLLLLNSSSVEFSSMMIYFYLTTVGIAGTPALMRLALTRPFRLKPWIFSRAWSAYEEYADRKTQV
jgi:hypothetical protein